MAAEVARAWAGLREPAASLTQRQVTALAGLIYRNGFGPYVLDHPGPPSMWEDVLRLQREAREAGKLAEWMGSLVDGLLLKEGVRTDDASRARLIDAADAALI